MIPLSMLSTLLVYMGFGCYLLALLIRKRLGWSRRAHITAALTGFTLDIGGTALMEYQRVTGQVHFAELPPWVDEIHLTASIGALTLFWVVAFLGFARIRRWWIGRFHYTMVKVFLTVWLVSAISGWFYRM